MTEREQGNKNHFKQWVNNNKDLLDKAERDKRRDEEKIETKTLQEGVNIVMLDNQVRQPTSKLFSWESSGTKRVRWFYHYDEYALIIPDTVHFRIVKLLTEFPDLAGVKVIAQGDGKQRRYTDIIPIFPDINVEMDKAINKHIGEVEPENGERERAETREGVPFF